MRALVVDDSPLSRRLSRGILERAGTTVLEAPEGGAALALLGLDPAFDLVLFDWQMLPVTGYAFARAVRAQPRFAGLRLIMLTVETGPAYHQQAIAAGAEAVLVKPLTAAALNAVLARTGSVAPLAKRAAGSA
jgi:CheY-like chemotaxis protein